MINVFVYLVDMPTKVHEVVTPSDDGSYTIYLNARLDYYGRVKAYHHAMKHIENNDFESDEDINTIECRAHKKSDSN